MTSRRSSSKVVLNQESPRTSSGSLSSRSSSSRSSTSSNYGYSNYAYSNYETSATSSMGREDNSQKASSRPRENFLRVPDASCMARTPYIFSPYANSIPAAASKDGIRTVSRGHVDVINHEKGREDKSEPRSSEAKNADYHKTSTSRKHKK